MVFNICYVFFAFLYEKANSKKIGEDISFRKNAGISSRATDLSERGSTGSVR